MCLVKLRLACQHLLLGTVVSSLINAIPYLCGGDCTEWGVYSSALHCEGGSLTRCLSLLRLLVWIPDGKAYTKVIPASTAWQRSLSRVLFRRVSTVVLPAESPARTVVGLVGVSLNCGCHALLSPSSTGVFRIVGPRLGECSGGHRGNGVHWLSDPMDTRWCGQCSLSLRKPILSIPLPMANGTNAVACGWVACMGGSQCKVCMCGLWVEGRNRLLCV